MHRLGIDSYGLDGSATAILHAPSEVFVVQSNLGRPFLLNQKFEIVSCIEVAEHLPRRSAKPLVRSLVSHSTDSILFSAAHPGQGGVGHVNERPAAYWEALFAEQGWLKSDTETEIIKLALRISHAPDYLLTNLMLLRRAGTNGKEHETNSLDNL